MAKLQYHVSSNGEQTFVTVFIPGGQPLAADSTHPNFERIVVGALAGDPSVADLFDLAKTAATKFDKVAGSERITVSGGRVYLDGDEVDNALTKQIVRFISEGADFAPLVRFFENLMQNPQEDSRTQLYSWLNADDFTITDEGMILGYKGVQPNGDGFVSIKSGRAIVNGEVQEGRITQNIGDVVEMPRSDVAFDPDVACHTGLHVGTYAYADSFSQGALLEVHVNPRDVVSVPRDSNAQKMRVCRYTVVGTLEGRVNTAVQTGYWNDDAWGDGEGEWEDYCEECGDALEDCLCDDYEEPSATQPLPPVNNSRRVEVGQVYEDRDSRRNGRTLTILDLNSPGEAWTVSSTGVRRSVSLDRLLSRHYKRVG